ncbi:PREDICTED: TRMT1-like protein [Priapulus caudatus]|uniref:tRNA (guanine(26)-N(2))-dimethyltransferase n=1 Tax=Priapulus caudatus TaxID=37621 RepID=A0ABM1E7J7_PRICU|nr:PREDICTED: TRMT1-like protein [Priapulus caudatus]
MGPLLSGHTTSALVQYQDLSLGALSLTCADIRNLVLCTLAGYLSWVKKESHVKIECLDAFSATGLMGLTWKRYFQDLVKVTLCDNNETAVACIRENCKLNQIASVTEQPKEEVFDSLTPTSQSLGMSKIIGTADNVGVGLQGRDPPMGASSGVDDSDSVTADGDASEVEVVHSDINVLLHQRGFDFVHLDPYGSPVYYLDAAFRNIRNDGVLTITATDVSALYGKCPQVTLRSYSGTSMKNEYTKELAARLILAAVVRAAARCNKGVKVLVTAAAEHFIFTAVHVYRGTTFADQCLSKIQKVLHCQMCEERTFIPRSPAPLEKPCSLLSCKCSEEITGRTAVVVGPVWSGDLYDESFLNAMLDETRRMKLNDGRLISMLQTMRSEARCSGIDAPCRTTTASSTTPPKTNQESDTQQCHEKTNVCDTSNVGEFAPVRDVTNKSDGGILENVPIDGAAAVAEQMKPLVNENRQVKRCASEEAAGLRKKRREEFNVEPTMPAFFYNLHRHSLKAGNLLRVERVIHSLQAEGYLASRTHFDARAVRTNATLCQLKQVMEKSRDISETCQS